MPALRSLGDCTIRLKRTYLSYCAMAHQAKLESTVLATDDDGRGLV